MKILMTGGNGLLGRHIMALDDHDLWAPSREILDIMNPEQINKVINIFEPDCVLHLAAQNAPLIHERNPERGLSTNIMGTANIALACIKFGKRMVYTSTDYVYVGKGPHKEDEPVLPPYNFGWSKLGGECSVRLVPNHLVLRLDFGPRPFPWDKVYKDQYVSKLYVDEMAPLVLAATKSTIQGVLNLGGPRTTLEDYARRTKPNIESINKPDWVPFDTSMDITKMKEFL